MLKPLDFRIAKLDGNTSTPRKPSKRAFNVASSSARNESDSEDFALIIQPFDSDLGCSRLR